MEKGLELRMYGFTPYIISDIQKSIQFGHAVVEYGLENFNTDEYQNWARNHKTFIILNGGTSNHVDPEYVGTMENIVEELKANDIKFATFNEPDLNDMLSAIVFIVDERVFNRKKYLDLGDWIWANKSEYLSDRMITTQRIDKMYRNGYFQTDANKEEKEIYNEWVDSIGGEKNVRLRDFLSGLKLA